ncbi:hypothetical protein [Furfurilactobacillus entadae]|uniref:hypothetical protein n=1 Tax=Furfurilactobacillus entadae TaxID=2922307 RepID=UPI0035E8956B
MDYHESLANQQQAYRETAGFYGWVRDHRQVCLWVTFILAALAIELPFLLNNHLFGGWDQQFHVNRIEELYLSAKHGVWHNAISTYTFKGSGLGIQIFYPYVFLYPYALLRLIGIPGITALYLGNVFYIVLSAWVCYWCMRTFLRLRGAQRPELGAWFFSMLYNVAGYMVFNDTVRFDLPESQSMTWYVILFLGLYMTLTKQRRGWLLTTLGAVLLVYTHVLSALLAAGIVVLVLIIAWRQLDDLRTWRDLILTGLVTAVIAAPELVVMLKTTHQVVIESPRIGSLYTQTITPFVAVFYGLANVTKTGLLTHGVTLGTVVLVGMIATWFGFRHLDHLGKTLLILSTVLFWATTRLFPWQLFEKTPIRLIQHPWRLYTFISLFALVALTLLVDRIDLTFRWRNWAVGLSLLLTLGTGFTYTALAKPRVTPASYQTFATKAEYFDYAPQSSLKHLKSIYHHDALIRAHGHVVKTIHVHMAAQPNGMTVTVPTSARGQVVDLPIFNYGGGYAVTTNHGKTLTAHVSKRGTVQVNVPRGTTTLRVQYRSGL